MTDTQRMEALKHANHIRLSRAQLKREVRAGERAAEDVVLDLPPYCKRMRVMELLRAHRYWGVGKCKQVMDEADVSEIRTLGTLTMRQRQALAEAITRRKEIMDKNRKANRRKADGQQQLELFDGSNPSGDDVPELPDCPRCGGPLTKPNLFGECGRCENSRLGI